MKKIAYALASTGLAAVVASNLPSSPPPAYAGLPGTTLLNHLLHKAEKVGPNLYSIAPLGNVLLVEGCAYHVNTRLALSKKVENKQEQQAVSGAITPAKEMDGSRVCDKGLKERSALVYGEGKGNNLYRLREHPFVISIRPDGCEFIAPGLYDPHTEGWSVKDPTQAVPVTWHDGTPNCHSHFAKR